MFHLASNEVEERNKAKSAYDNARQAGVTGRDLDTLKAAYDAAEARVKSATGGSGSWGILS